MRAKEEQLVLRRTPAGIPVIVDKLSYSRSAAVAVYMGVGSRDEEEEKCGIAHLLEHLMFKGTESRTAKEISEQVEAAGGEMNGYTGREVTCYFIQTIDETIATAEELLADIVRNPRLVEKDVEMEKMVVAQEIKMSEDEPEGYIHDLFAKTAWKGNPMANSEGGRAECIMPLTARDIRSFYDTHYRPPKLHVVATGNVDIEQVVDWASKAFDDLPGSDRRSVRKPPAFHAGTSIYPREGDQVYAAMGFPSLDAHHPDRYVQTMLSVILGAGTSSRLYQKVREENGLVYSIYAMSTPFTDTGAMAIYFSTSSENAEKVLRLVSSELRRLKDEGLEQGELDRAKNWLKGLIVRKLEPTDNRMYFLGEQFLQTGELMTEGQILRRMDSVTEEQVQRSAVKTLDATKMCVALHTSQKEGGRISRAVGALDF